MYNSTILLLFLALQRLIPSVSWLGLGGSDKQPIITGNYHNDSNPYDYGVDVSTPIHRYLDPNTFQVECLLLKFIYDIAYLILCNRI